MMRAYVRSILYRHTKNEISTNPQFLFLPINDISRKACDAHAAAASVAIAAALGDPDKRDFDDMYILFANQKALYTPFLHFVLVYLAIAQVLAEGSIKARTEGRVPPLERSKPVLLPCLAQLLRRIEAYIAQTQDIDSAAAHNMREGLDKVPRLYG
jgi:hypothetical protein